MDYFGEKLPDFCGNCDSCIRPKGTFDGTEAARKLITCIQELNQRFGTNYVIDVLTGSKNKKIKQNRNEKLKSHGSGRDFTKEQWRSLVSEMANTGLLEVSGAQYPVLKLNAMSRKILKGLERVELICPEGFVPESKECMVSSTAVDIKDERVKNNSQPSAEELSAGNLSTERHSAEEFSADILKTSKVKPGIKSGKGPDPILFERLKALRKEIALKKNLPPYIIFSDTTLKEMATKFPRSPEEFHSITGVGDHKLRKYGDTFLAEIEHYCRDYDLLPAGKTRDPVSADKQSENERIIPKGIGQKNENSGQKDENSGQKDENSGLEAEIEAFEIKAFIPESDKTKNSEAGKLPLKRARYLDMSIQDWSGTDSSVDSSNQSTSIDNSQLSTSIESFPESEVSNLLKKKLIEANSIEADSIETECLGMNSIEVEPYKAEPFEAEFHKTEKFETNNPEIDSLKRTYSLFTQGLEIDQIAEIQGLSIGAVFSQFEKLILTGKVKDIGRLLPPQKQQQIKAALEVLEIELNSLIRAKIGEGCQEEELKLVRALLLSKIGFSQS